MDSHKEIMDLLIRVQISVGEHLESDLNAKNSL